MRKQYLRQGALAGAVLGLAALALPAQAEVRAIPGDSLSLTLTTGEDTAIEPDASLHHAARLISDNTGCLDAASFGGEVRVGTAPCGSDSGKLTVMVPVDFPVTLLIAGSGNVHTGDLKGPLKVTLTSDGDLSAGHIGLVQLAIRGSGDATLRSVEGPADIDVSGSGTVKLYRLDGPLRYSQHGSGDLAISHIEAPGAQFEGAGSGDIAILDGHVAALQVRLYGSGDFAMGGTVDTADLEATGGGDIRVPNVTATVRRSAHGGSTIVVGGGGDIAGSAMQRLSKSMASDDDSGDGGAADVSINHTTGGFGHFIAGLVVLGVLIAVWRTVMRHGGPAAFRNRFAAAGTPAPPRDPGVIALCDLLAGLEKRLARVEIHVTSKEFDLNRKFREMGADPK